MVPPGPPTPIGGAQSSFPQMVSQRTQFNNMNNMLGNMSNVTSMLNQSFPNGIPNSGLSGPGSSQRGGIDNRAEQDPLSSVGNGMSFGNPSSPFVQSNMVSPGSSGQGQGQGQGQQFSNASGNQLLAEQQHAQQLEARNFQHSQQQSMQDFSTLNAQQQQQQQHFQSVRGGMGGIGPVKLEPQVNNDKFGQQQQLPSFRNLASVKLEPQQLQAMRGLAPVKMEPQHSDQQFLHQQQQQQQLLQMSRQSSQAAAAQMNLLQQQRLLQIQQHQQQLLKAMPQQRSQLQQQLQQQNMPIMSPAKPTYEPGMCARRLTHYMYQQQHRPEVIIILDSVFFISIIFSIL